MYFAITKNVTLANCRKKLLFRNYIIKSMLVISIEPYPSAA
jgi:hypothetical protein